MVPQDDIFVVAPPGVLLSRVVAFLFDISGGAAYGLLSRSPGFQTNAQVRSESESATIVRERARLLHTNFSRCALCERSPAGSK